MFCKACMVFWLFGWILAHRWDLKKARNIEWHAELPIFDYFLSVYCSLGVLSLLCSITKPHLSHHSACQSELVCIPATTGGNLGCPAHSKQGVAHGRCCQQWHHNILSAGQQCPWVPCTTHHLSHLIGTSQKWICSSAWAAPSQLSNQTPAALPFPVLFFFSLPISPIVIESHFL